jgi:hypothetical protein
MRSRTFDRVGPGLCSDVVYVIPGPPTMTESALRVTPEILGLLGTRMTPMVLEPTTTPSCLSCSSKVALPGTNVPLPTVVLDATIGPWAVQLPIGITPADRPHVTS